MCIRDSLEGVLIHFCLPNAREKPLDEGRQGDRDMPRRASRTARAKARRATSMRNQERSSKCLQ
eukprot:938125-Alexandrium_andersonii.AAC.1